MEMLLFLLILTGVGVFMMGLPLPPLLTYSGNLVCELFMTIFNIHFFTQVQTKVEGDYLGRVLSTIFTLAILFMPVPKRTQSKIKMIKGNLNWTKRKFTVTDCMFAREIPAINKIKSNKAM